MDAKDFIKNNRRLALFSLVGLFGVVILAVAALVVADQVNSKNEQRFEEIINRLAKIKGPEEKGEMDAVVADLKKFSDSTYFGFAHNASYYVLGNIYYDRKNWGESKQHLLRFADNNKKSVLAPLALLKASLALEELKDIKGALELYKRLEERYTDSPVADQIFYNYARVCALNGDLVNSRMYYNKVISAYPDSVYAQQSKRRLFLLGAL